MRVCGRLSARDRAPLPAQAAALDTVYHGLAWNGEAHAAPEAWEPLRGPQTAGPRWLGCAGEAPGPSRGWAFVINESRPPSCRTPVQPGFRPWVWEPALVLRESPHLQPGQDLPAWLAFLLPTSLECWSPRLYEGMSAGCWVSCPSNLPSLPPAPKSWEGLPALLSCFRSYPDCLGGGGAPIPSLKLGQRPSMSQGITPPTPLGLMAVPGSQEEDPAVFILGGRGQG